MPKVITADALLSNTSNLKDNLPELGSVNIVNDYRFKKNIKYSILFYNI